LLKHLYPAPEIVTCFPGDFRSVKHGNFLAKLGFEINIEFSVSYGLEQKWANYLAVRNTTRLKSKFSHKILKISAFLSCSKYDPVLSDRTTKEDTKRKNI
jgi:hypothetical protein